MAVISSLSNSYKVCDPYQQYISTATKIASATNLDSGRTRIAYENGVVQEGFFEMDCLQAALI